MHISVGDVDLYVHEHGEGRPLVALHGGPGLDGSVWFPALAPLATEGFRILAPDHRGNGRSEAGDPGRWTVPQMADDVEALIGALRLERPVVMGHSFGSFVAQNHMIRHGSAAGYVLIGTVSEPGALERVWERLERFQPERLRKQVTVSWERESTVATAEECKHLMDDQWPFHLADPEGPLVEWLIANDRIVYRPEVLRHFATDGNYGLEDWRDELRGVQKPVLILSGEHDRTTPAASAHELAELLPNAEEVVIAGAAHMILQEQPDESLAALRRFLARV